MSGTLSNIVNHFAPIWAGSSGTSTADGKKVLSFLLNLVSCVCVLPPTGTPVLPSLDKRLLPAFGALCAAEPELRELYSVVAAVALRAMLEAKTTKGIFQLADEVGVDVDDCTSKDAVVQAMLASGKCLLPGPATGDRAVLETQSMLELCVLARDMDVDITLGKKQVIRMILASGKRLEPLQNATTDRAALLVLFGATNGRSWKKNTGWGTSRPLGEWYGVVVDGGGRVIKLILNDNNLAGARDHPTLFVAESQSVI